jgi:hypothetical protein
MISAHAPSPFGLSLSKAFLPSLKPEVEGKGFDRLSPNGSGPGDGAS